jgi:hypothetical protein
MGKSAVKVVLTPELRSQLNRLVMVSRSIEHETQMAMILKQISQIEQDCEDILHSIKEMKTLLVPAKLAIA